MTPEAANEILSRPNATDIRFIEDALRAFQSGIQNDKLALSRLDPNAISKGDAEILFNLGRKAVEAKDNAKDKTVAGGKTKRRKGIVKGEGVTISDLRKTFNDTQGMAYKYLSTVAKVTGIDIVLYRSVAGPDGKFQGAQGRYSRSEPGTIYIDLNAGLSDVKSADDLAKYAMLRTFAHEFTHFIENWNPIQYNELRKVVFDTLTQRGENVSNLIEEKQTHNPGMDYDKASREVVAEAMTDILPDANFVQELAENHKNIFKKLFEKLNEFVENLRKYFTSIGYNPSREANVLKEQVGNTVKYLDNIVQLFDQAAVQAVENYQADVHTENAVSKRKNDRVVQEQSRVNNDEKAALLYYKSSGSYLLNAKLREDIDLTEQEQFVVAAIDSALGKLPAYKGKVYRNILFDELGGQEARNAFVAEHTVGNIVSYAAYTSASTEVDGYTVEGDFIVHLVINSANSRNMEGYGNNFESEVLFARNTLFMVNDVKYDVNGTPTIYLTEVENEETDERGRSQEALSGNHRGQQNTSAESNKTEVQQVSKSASGNSEMQTASGRDSKRDSLGKEELRSVQHQQRTNTLTSRDILSELPESVAQDDLELYILKKYQDQLSKVREQEQIQAKLNEDIKKLAPDQKEKLLQLQIELTKTKNRLNILNKNLKDTESAKPLGAILQREAPKILEKLRERYGTIPKGEKAVRDDALPVSTDGKNKVSRTARTVKGAAVTTDEFAGLIDTEVAKGGLTYLPISNDETAQKAAAWVKKVGWTAA